MGLSDPFGTTYQGAFQGGSALGQGIQSAAGTFAQALIKRRQQQQTMDLLKQAGILVEKPVEVKDQVKAFEDIANKTIKNTYGELTVQGEATTDEQKLQLLNTLFDKFGIQKPQIKSKGLILDYDKAAKIGLDYNLTSGEASLKPTRAIPTLAQQIQEIQALDEAKKKGLVSADVGFAAGEKGIKLKSTTGRNIADPSDLTSEQQIQGRGLARKIYGVRGAEFGLPAIYEEMRKGKNIDEIEDSLRYAGQSKEFSGPVREAAQSVLINTPQDKAQTAMDYIDDLLSKNDTEGVKNQLKRLARTKESVEQQAFVVGKERTIKLLDEIQGDLNNLEKMGVNTNIFTGTAEQIAGKLGTTLTPEARKVATKIATAIQNYRRSMTGVQFGMPENKEYKVMFPSIGRTAEFNSANVNALKEVMAGDLDNFYSLSMGEDAYRSIFGKQDTGQAQESKQGAAKPTQGKDEYGFSIGETRYSNKYKKNLTYIGDNQWQ